MKRQSVYVYRTDRPSGWGRHTAYVGRTCHLDLRHAQHTVRQPWSDLRPRRYVLVSFRRCPVWCIAVVEWLAIKALMPAYNVQHNMRNPRRIKPWTARAARLARDAGYRPYGARVRDVASVTPVALVVCAALYLWSR